MLFRSSTASNTRRSFAAQLAPGVVPRAPVHQSDDRRVFEAVDDVDGSRPLVQAEKLFQWETERLGNDEPIHACRSILKKERRDHAPRRSLFLRIILLAPAVF